MTASRSQQPDIFISYSTRDTPFAEAVCTALEGSRLTCWIAPRNILPAQSWTEAIIDGINGAKVLVLILSDSSNSSPQVLREVERAVSKRIPVLALRIEEVALSKALEYLLSVEQWLDAITEPRETHLRQLVESVQRLVEPGVELILVAAPSRPPATTSAVPRAARPHNLPRQLTSFIGREQEVREIKQLLRQDSLLTLVGPGGTGKTRLAYHIAAEILHEYPQGVWTVEFAPLAESSLVPQAAAAVLGVREEPGRALTQTLMDYLRPKSLLLILDNCEHLIAACADLANTLLQACPDLRILATSRVGLDILGEAHYPVPPLSAPIADPHPSAEVLRQNEAVRLFIDRSQAISPKWVESESGVTSIAHICRRLDGIPLAIELAAARVNTMPIEQIASRLDDRFHLLTKGRRTDLPHHQTLKALIDWSYDLLTKPERTLLRRLSIFTGGWTLSAAEAVCAGFGGEGVGDRVWSVVSEKEGGERLSLHPTPDTLHPDDVLDLLTSLVDKSLVIYQDQDGEARYMLLETVRQYSLDRLLEAAQGEEEAVRERHCDFFTRLAEQAAPELLSMHQRRWLDRLETEHDNLRAALEWRINPGKGEKGKGEREEMEGKREEGRERDEKQSSNLNSQISGLALAGALSLYWFFGSYLSEGWDYLMAFLAREAAAPATVRLKALTGAGILAYFRGDLAAAQQLCAEALSLPREREDMWHVCIALSILGTLSYYQGYFEQATTLFQESLEIAQVAEDPWLKALALSTLGLVALHQGDVAQAQKQCEESLALARGVGERWCNFNSRYSLGIVMMVLSDYRQARVLFEEALALSRDLGHFVSVTVCLEGLAGVYAAEGSAELATLIFGAAAARREALGIAVPPAFRANYEQNIGALRAAIGETKFEVLWSEGQVMTLEQAIGKAVASGQ